VPPKPPSSHPVLTGLGRRVAELRLERGLTQERLAERLRVAPRYIQQIEGGRQNIEVLTAHRLAKALRVELVELFRPSNLPARGGLRRVPSRAVRRG
jgi:transcriptional regulator with XRE-family HTH domain